MPGPKEYAGEAAGQKHLSARPSLKFAAGGLRKCAVSEENHVVYWNFVFFGYRLSYGPHHLLQVGMQANVNFLHHDQALFLPGF